MNDEETVIGATCFVRQPHVFCRVLRLFCILKGVISDFKISGVMKFQISIN
jgi:hypothetical protein